MKTDLNNAVLKSIVTTLQSKVDDLEAENRSLREGPLPAADNTKFSEIAFSLKHSNDHLFKERDQLVHLFKERDQLVEENARLFKNNTKLATRVRKIESGNFDEYFTYSTPPITLAAGGEAISNISITREADFYVTKIVRIGTAPFSFLVRDSSNDRQWSNIPLHSDIGAGTAQSPLILPKPRFVGRASTITVETKDLSLATNEVRVAFIGYKVYHVENLYHATGKEKKASKAAAYDVWGGLPIVKFSNMLDLAFKAAFSCNYDAAANAPLAWGGGACGTG